MIHIPKELLQIADLMSQMPSVTSPVPVSTEVVPEAHVRCVCDKKLIHRREVKVHWSGKVHVEDTTCSECMRGREDYSLLVCEGCRKLLFRFAPHVTKSGFEFRKNRIYHVRKCPRCITSHLDGIELPRECSEVVELEEHNKQNPKIIIQ